VSVLYARFGMKRAVDVAGAWVGLLLLLPIVALLSLLLFLSEGRPIFFRQARPGRGGAPFVLVKFRTMRTTGREEELTLPDARRLTTSGRLLRRWSLDELPTLWNVLKGDMSLVGPRPLLMEYLPLYTPEQARRHEVRPGITGWAQVNGRNALSWEEKFELDVWYVDNMSLWLDLKILWMTVVKVLKREGISAEGHATMPRFEGSRR
jgi:sugar transferase EpsL